MNWITNNLIIKDTNLKNFDYFEIIIREDGVKIAII